MSDTAKGHVFVSYVREDAQTVEQLAADLRAAGVHVWLDRDQIRPGERWRSAISAAIRQGAFFLACFSDNWSRRDRSYMHEELLLAIAELRKRRYGSSWFIPLLLDRVQLPPYDIGPGETISDLQWVDFTLGYDTAMAKLLELLAVPPPSPTKRTWRTGVALFAIFALLLALAFALVTLHLRYPTSSEIVGAQMSAVVFNVGGLLNRPNTYVLERCRHDAASVRCDIRVEGELTVVQRTRVNPPSANNITSYLIDASGKRFVSPAEGRLETGNLAGVTDLQVTVKYVLEFPNVPPDRRVVTLVLQVSEAPLFGSRTILFRNVPLRISPSETFSRWLDAA